MLLSDSLSLSLFVNRNEGSGAEGGGALCHRGGWNLGRNVVVFIFLPFRILKACGIE